MAIRALRTAKEATTPSEPVVDEIGDDLDDGLDEGALVGARIRELRKAEGLTLHDVASQVGVSVSYLSQVERDVSRLTIGVLKRISDVLGVHMNWFFHGGVTGPADERDIVVRAANRRNLSFPGLGITEELLSPNLAGPLELLISTIQPGADSDFYSHDGAEAGVVIDGTLDLWVGDRRFQLQPGDSFAFPSTELHRCANFGTDPVRVLWVITPPHY